MWQVGECSSAPGRGADQGAGAAGAEQDSKVLTGRAGGREQGRGGAETGAVGERWQWADRRLAVCAPNTAHSNRVIGRLRVLRVHSQRQHTEQEAFEHAYLLGPCGIVLIAGTCVSVLPEVTPS